MCVLQIECVSFKLNVCPLNWVFVPLKSVCLLFKNIQPFWKQCLLKTDLSGGYLWLEWWSINIILIISSLDNWYHLSIIGNINLGKDLVWYSFLVDGPSHPSGPGRIKHVKILFLGEKFLKYKCTFVLNVDCEIPFNY